MDTSTAHIDQPQLYRIAEDGAHEFAPHYGQWRALESTKRFILVLAGSQSGKTVIGPLWLRDEIERRGQGDYLAIAPSYPLMQKKMLPEFIRLFESQLGLGIYHGGDRIFKFFDGITKVFFGHADDPESLESATAKAAWLDECGQNRFRLGSWEAIQRRLALNQGRVLMTTTPYNLGWMKQLLYDKWEAAKRNHPDIDVINFASNQNPAFPQAEYDRLRLSMPRWKFNMFHRGLFERPAGMIYDCFDRTRHVWPRFEIPVHWNRNLGLDFGGVNTAGVFFAEERTPDGKPLTQMGYLAAPGPLDKPTGRYFAYREYWPKEARSAQQHKDALVQGEPRLPTCAGGAKSEGQWRLEFARVGLPIMHPVTTDVEVGIQRLYDLFSTDRLIIFEDLVSLIDDVSTYSRELNDAGDPTDEIEDKETYHLADAGRYFAVYVNSRSASGWKLEVI